MKLAIMFAVAAIVAFAGGCRGTSAGAHGTIKIGTSGVAVSMAALSEAPETRTLPQDAAPVSLRLGAGDALGRRLFASYVVFARANSNERERLASGDPSK